MPRRPRLHVPGGLYHVMLRGNNRRAIFFDNDDRQRWESLLAEGLARYGQRIHAYCWMTNHIHMAVQCRVEPVSALMRFVASQYSRSTNRKMQRSGHLFERRHCLVLVQADCYLKALVRYIHQNPLRAGIVEDLSAYRWSSHRAYLGETGLDWLTTEWVLSMFGPSLSGARNQYRKFTQHRDELLEQTFRVDGASDDRIPATDGFADSVTGGLNCRQPRESLDEIVARICLKNGVTEAELCSRLRSRKNASIRAKIALAAIETGAATLAIVARRFNRSESVLSRSLSRMHANRSGIE